MAARGRDDGADPSWLASVMLVLAAPFGLPEARAADPKALLAAIDAAARARVVVRADGELERPDGPPLPILLVRRGTAVYLEAGDGTRALLKPGKAVMAVGGIPQRVPPATVLANTDVLFEDLAPFTTRRLVMPQVSDDGPVGVAVTGEPRAPTAYALLVVTVDPERAAVVRAKYYVGSVTNLVKMRRDRELVDVGGRSWPDEITVEHFRPPRTTRLRLAWREAPELRIGLATLRGPGLLGAGGPATAPAR